MKRIRNPGISSEDIQGQCRDGIRYRKMCHDNNAKRKTEEIETTKSRKNRTCGEKDSY